ncbi:hypothetical protein BaRGS_00025503 [Batillaria attramentaria]|uniref:Uncharacterized protein n=1 Tax=Batillaria attramentaria TaxID=370345 RepID=A0ABD0K7Z8_9CAEN
MRRTDETPSGCRERSGGPHPVSGSRPLFVNKLRSIFGGAWMKEVARSCTRHLTTDQQIELTTLGGNPHVYYLSIASPKHSPDKFRNPACAVCL